MDKEELITDIDDIKDIIGEIVNDMKRQKYATAAVLNAYWGVDHPTHWLLTKEQATELLNRFPIPTPGEEWPDLDEFVEAIEKTAVLKERTSYG